MTIIPINKDRPSASVILASALDEVKEGHWDQCVIVLMSPDNTSINWSSMSNKTLAFATLMLQRAAINSMDID